jgi:hypothetical protein
VCRVGSALAVLLVSVVMSGCASNPSTSAPTSVRHISVDYTKHYNSIDDLLADTKLLVIATARSVTADHSAPPTRPLSLVTMDVDDVVRGNAGPRIVVSEIGGQPGVVVNGQVPIEVGHTYLLCLGLNRQTGRFYVLNGVTGLFSFDTATETATRLDPSATWIPQSVSLFLVRSYLETLARNGQGPEPTPTSSTTSTTSTTTPPVSGACPPGCHLPSDYDAITVMASSATLVAVVTVHDLQVSGSVARADVTTDKTLQGNAYDNVYPPNGPDFGIVAGVGQLVVGKTYLVFMSFNRGGSCLSTLFSYDSTSQVATFVEKDDAPQANEILLSGRILPVRATIPLAALQARLYPVGGVVYPDGTAEWYCPGP